MFLKHLSCASHLAWPRVGGIQSQTIGVATKQKKRVCVTWKVLPNCLRGYRDDNNGEG